MQQEHPIYLSQYGNVGLGKIGRIVVPSFAKFCEGFSGRAIGRLYLTDDEGSMGLHLETDDRSIDLVYRAGVFEAIHTNSETTNVYWYLNGKEHLLAKRAANTEAEFFIAKHEKINEILSSYTGSRLVRAIVEPEGGVSNRLAGRFIIPENTAMFWPGYVSILANKEIIILMEGDLYMKDEDFLHALCSSSSGTVKYVPKELEK